MSEKTEAMRTMSGREPVDLDALEALFRVTTSSDHPWEFRLAGDAGEVYTPRPDGSKIQVAWAGYRHDDARWIAAAHNTFLDLIGRIAKLEAERDRAHKTVAYAVDQAQAREAQLAEMREAVIAMVREKGYIEVDDMAAVLDEFIPKPEATP